MDSNTSLMNHPSFYNTAGVFILLRSRFRQHMPFVLHFGTEKFPGHSWTLKKCNCIVDWLMAQVWEEKLKSWYASGALTCQPHCQQSKIRKICLRQ